MFECVGVKEVSAFQWHPTQLQTRILLECSVNVVYVHSAISSTLYVIVYIISYMRNMVQL